MSLTLHIITRTILLGGLLLGCSEWGNGAKINSTVSLVAESALSNVTTSLTPASSVHTKQGRSDELLNKVYASWTPWGPCSKGCQQSRKRLCKKELQCGKSYIKEKRKCKTRRSCSKHSKRKYIKLLGLRKSDKLVTEILYNILYSPWTSWSVCNRSCKKQRRRNCIQPIMCGGSYVQEERVCKRSSLVCKKQYILRTFVPINDKKNNMDENVIYIKNITHTVMGNTTNSNIGPKVSDADDRMKSNPQILKNMTFTCGVQRSDRAGSYRVIGGRESRKHAWPWQVAILKWNEQFCGGTLIAPQWVLTAAHCVRKKKRRRRISLMIGEHNMKVKDKGEQAFKVLKDYPHPQYDFDTITNDIALLKLAKPVIESDSVGFACLPEAKDKLKEKHMCYILGWGKEKSTDMHGSNVLREAQVPLVKKKTCQRAFNYPIYETQVCAGNKHGGIDSCAGDSGGPLLCPKYQDGVKKWIVYGVTSYGEGCGEKKKFGIYTKVRKYLDWINKVITSETN